MPGSAPVTVVEMPEFMSRIRKLLDDSERGALIDYLAFNPMAGDLIQGTGGVRKLRWRLEGRGKRGGARVIYYYHSEDLPLFLLSAYAKNVRANVPQADRNDFRRLTKILVDGYARKKR